MSISTPSGEPKNPGVVKVSGKPAAKPGARPGNKNSGGKAPGGKPATGGKGGAPRKPVTPVKVTQGRNWGPIALFTVVGLIAAGIIGFAAWAAFQPGGAGYAWQTQAESIDGIVNYRESTELTRGHAWGPHTYAQSPPVGGDHNDLWQQCMGNIYDNPIPNEHAVHSLEHGAVWITYRSGLPQDQIDKLAARVEGQEFMMMSPIEGLDKPISLQAWGYQLKVDNADDSRIDAFINALRKNATLEPIAGCSGGNTAVGTQPLTEQQAQELLGGGMQ